MRLSALVLLLALASLLALYHQHVHPAMLADDLRHTGLFAPVIFVVLYALGALIFLPGLVFTLSAGALFGMFWGTVWSLAGATLGATLAFLIGRYLATGWIAQRLNGRLSRLLTRPETQNWRLVAFVRLVPVFPYNLINYVLGLTQIGLVTYVVTSALCMLPSVAAYTYVGYTARAAASGDFAAIQKMLFALGLITALAFLPQFFVWFRARRRTLAEAPPADLAHPDPEL